MFITISDFDVFGVLKQFYKYLLTSLTKLMNQIFFQKLKVKKGS